MTDLAALRQEAVERACAELGENKTWHALNDDADWSRGYWCHPLTAAELALDASGLLAHIERLEAVVEAARTFEREHVHPWPGSVGCPIGRALYALDNLNEQPTLTGEGQSC